VVQQKAEFSGGINLWSGAHSDEEPSGNDRGLAAQVVNVWSADRGTNVCIL
jgi:hypothetical protein